MSRVKGGVVANRRRKNILEETKGYRHARSTKKRAAREAIYHAQSHAFAHRKDKKNVFRQLWIVRLSAALRAHGLKYSLFIKTLAAQEVALNRKMLAAIADQRPEAFERILAKVK
ncbi:50S ribosomal protein L20 [Candidatus Parcubacteria bacterium]|uniref:Large ribosomal subunit protein bL20 n=1 Tax=Candidatus Kaiserbacteria bacterium CG10_big_fil_rev_8_21_14_0_10_47_16 TaxID=1974608 RepID=A0A2H0UFY4_9BACT|nr:50S ribosomal protein L20 [Candidatus Parcubacteria bacterium]PIR84596.1 MAG: 50S ribosomal protein L20 [Candidatus Kaiserbacteria bacterium CG10_big_fil_rev_8_21_14_0_10_47_16]